MQTGKIVENALRALLYEVSATPKPGLVDRDNNGAHRDMDFYSFIDSSARLTHYFKGIEVCLTNLYSEHQNLLPAEKVFSPLVKLGIQAEIDMKDATGGVNTHKGAIYALGLLTAASIECLLLEMPIKNDVVLKRVSEYVAPTLESSIQNLNDAKSYGQIQYEELGLLGARGEAFHQYPSVTDVALPMLEEALSRGATMNDALIHALIGLMAVVMDSNVIGRHDVTTLKYSQSIANEILTLGSVFTEGGLKAIKAYDDWCIEHYVSHGGCADLLAVAVFLHFLK